VDDIGKSLHEERLQVAAFLEVAAAGNAKGDELGPDAFDHLLERLPTLHVVEYSDDANAMSQLRLARRQHAQYAFDSAELAGSDDMKNGCHFRHPL
jgi:hypothetical protein